MKEISEEDLIGYFLGALEADQELRIKNALLESDHLRARLNQVETKLSDLPDRFVEIDPPEDLAKKTFNTIDIVETSVRGTADLQPGKPPSNSKSSHSSPLVSNVADNEFDRGRLAARHSAGLETSGMDRAFSGRSWSLMDMIVGAAVCFVWAVVLLPSIANSRFQSNLMQCQNNLRKIGYNLGSIADSFEGQVNLSMPDENWQAGQFVQMILEAELADDIGEFICPNDPGKEETAELCRLAWADRLDGSPSSYSLVTPEAEGGPIQYNRTPFESQQNTPSLAYTNLNRRRKYPSASSIRQTEAACGSYGFLVPTVNGGSYNAIQVPSGADAVLSADAACFDNPGFQSRNHAGKGQNVLLGDLSVDYIYNTACLPSGDHIYTNKLGEVQPGIGPGDNLIIRGVLPIQATWSAGN